MKKIVVGLLVAVVMLMIGAQQAHAILLSEVASNAYITKNGLDIAWASPCAPSAPSCGGAEVDLSFQAAYGWRVATQADMALINISATDFAFVGANVDYATGNNLDEATGAWLYDLTGPLPSFDVAVATPWFSNVWLHADWGDGFDGSWANLSVPGQWVVTYDSIVVRDVASVVPEPSTYLLLGSGLAGLIVWRRKRKFKA